MSLCRRHIAKGSVGIGGWRRKLMWNLLGRRRFFLIGGVCHKGCRLWVISELWCWWKSLRTACLRRLPPILMRIKLFRCPTLRSLLTSTHLHISLCLKELCRKSGMLKAITAFLSSRVDTALRSVRRSPLGKIRAQGSVQCATIVRSLGT